jgi:hypothetical protein
MMSKTFKQVLVFFLGVIFLNACATSNVSNDLEETDAMTHAPLDGIWVGEFDIRGRGPYDFTAVHLQDKAYAYSLKAKAMCVGTLSFDGEHLLNKYVLFALDGGPFDWANITGTLKDNGKNSKTISSYFKTLNGGDTGVLTVNYNNLYEQPSSLDYVKGEWAYTDRDALISNISISETGVLSGNDSDGCEYLGYLDVINPEYNMYHAKVEVSKCDSVNDEYEGVAFLADDILKVQIANKKYAFFYAFEKTY